MDWWKAMHRLSYNWLKLDDNGLVVGLCGTLVESKSFDRRVVSSKPACRDLGKVLNLQLPVALRCETPAQYP